MKEITQARGLSMFFLEWRHYVWPVNANKILASNYKRKVINQPLAEIRRRTPHHGLLKYRLELLEPNVNYDSNMNFHKKHIEIACDGAISWTMQTSKKVCSWAHSFDYKRKTQIFSWLISPLSVVFIIHGWPLKFLICGSCLPFGGENTHSLWI